jgi:hypothetical protein
MSENVMEAKARSHNEIDFTSFIYVLWNRRQLIFIGTICATLLSVIISIFLPENYRSEGFYQLGNPTSKIPSDAPAIDSDKDVIIRKSGHPTEGLVPPIGVPVSFGVPVPLYKRSSPQFFNPNRFQKMATKSRLFNDEEIKKLAIYFKSPESLTRWIKPVYAFSRDDAREFTLITKDESNAVLGMNLSFECTAPEIASAYVRFMGDYIRDCLIYFTLYN